MPSLVLVLLLSLLAPASPRPSPLAGEAYLLTCRARDDVRAGVTLMRDDVPHQACSLLPEEVRSVYPRRVRDQVTASLVQRSFPVARYFRIQGAPDFALTTQQRVDREELCTSAQACCDRSLVVCQFDLSVVFRVPLPGAGAREGGLQGSRLLFRKVAVRLTDVNDHAPTFPAAVQEVRIPESARQGERFAIHAAEDLDSEPYSVRRYRLEPANQEKFELAESRPLDGQAPTRLYLRLRQTLDRETEAQYNLSLIAVDNGSPRPKSGSMAIRVIVDDDNDNVPLFERSSYRVNVSEERAKGDVLIQVRATDKDAGRNGQVVYGIAPSADKEVKRTFEMEAASGRLFLTGTLDYESRRSYHIPIEAKDGAGSPSKGEAEVVVFVQDENDSPPVIHIDYDFAGQASRGRLREGPRPVHPEFAALVSVSDADSGPAGEFSCWLERTERFMLVAQSRGQFSLFRNGSLDRERTAEEKFDVCCADRGRVPKQKCRSVRIAVLDVNDHAPAFESASLHATVPENNAPHAFVTRVVATDADEGENALVSYSLDPKSAVHFEVGSHDGQIRARAPFDRELEDSYTLHVVARDAGTQPLSSTATVHVRVLDQNDNAPQFYREDVAGAAFHFEVREDIRPGSNIGRVAATDRDDKRNGEVHYTLRRPGNKPFRISLTTGQLSTTQALDREAVDRYVLEVVASDRGHKPRSSTATVTVAVKDYNDNPPRFTFPSGHNNSIRLSFKEVIGEEVARIHATDADEGQNALLHYQILSGNHRSLFHIDPTTGTLSVDQEMTPADVNAYRLKVAVQDSGDPVRSAHADLVIHVDKSRPRLVQNNRRHQQTLTRSSILVIIVALICAIILVLLFMTMYLCARKGLFGPDLADPVALLCHCGQPDHSKRRHDTGKRAGAPAPAGGAGTHADDDPAALAVAFLPPDGPPLEHAYANSGSDKVCPAPQYETYATWRADQDPRSLKRQPKRSLDNSNEYQLSAFAERDEALRTPKTDRMARKKFDLDGPGGVKASPSYPNRLQESGGQADGGRPPGEEGKTNFYEMYDSLLLDQTLGKTGRYYNTQRGSFV